VCLTKKKFSAPLIQKKNLTSQRATNNYMIDIYNSLYVCVYVSLTRLYTVCVCVRVCVPDSILHHVRMCVRMCMCVSVSLSVSLSLFLYVFIIQLYTVCVCVCVCVCLSLSLSLPLSLSVNTYSLSI